MSATPYPTYPAATAELQRRGLGYREAAAVARISSAQLWKALNGHQPLRDDVRDRLSRCLLLPLDEPTNDALPTRDDRRRSTYVQPQPEPAISS